MIKEIDLSVPPTEMDPGRYRVTIRILVSRVWRIARAPLPEAMEHNSQYWWSGSYLPFWELPGNCSAFGNDNPSFSVLRIQTQNWTLAIVCACPREHLILCTIDRKVLVDYLTIGVYFVRNCPIMAAVHNGPKGRYPISWISPGISLLKNFLSSEEQANLK